MRRFLHLWLGGQFLCASCQPYTPPTASQAPQITNAPGRLEGYHLKNIESVVEVYNSIEKRWIQARDTSESESTTSEGTSTTSESSTSTTEPTTTSSETSSASTSTDSTTTSTSTSTTSSTTTTSSPTTSTSTSTATSTSSAELVAWNHAGNNRAIVFGCCLVALFAGVITLHCALDRAKAKRIAARELLAVSSVSKTPLVSNGLSSGSMTDRSSLMFRDNPANDSRPQTPGMAPSPSRPLSAQVPTDGAAGWPDHTTDVDRRGSPV
ncbi:hypothetical protein N7492_003177 [Penicillium capsulatum]|uniref:Uncharacterized protein n=1 Tax=Penicillium capsulatum TaxID=69766 RepID=A0A9W9ILH9_9EURO|nr:hypothetical protein N7492_003177 [Penicillium capsulatum]KAJ6122234.1 hypothetical protein N7512_004699 [Penicillium capsulatum]